MSEPVMKYVHHQAVAMPEWHIRHGLNAHVIVRAFDENNEPLDQWPWYMTVIHEDANTVILRFRKAEDVHTAVAGQAVIIG